MSSSLARTSRPASGPAQAARQQLDELDALLQRMLDLPVQPVDDVPTPPDPLTPTIEELADTTASSLPPLPPLPGPRSYPSSYMVVETNAPPLPPAPSQSLMDVEQVERPVPGGRHDLVADQPVPDERPADGAPEEWVPFRSSWQPSAQTWAPLARTWEQARGLPNPPEPANSPPDPAPAAVHAGARGPQVAMQPIADAQAPTPKVSPAPVGHAPHPTPIPSGVLHPLVWFNAAFDLCLVPLGPPGRWLQGPSGRGTLGVIGVGCLVAAAALVAAEGFGWTW